MTVADIRQSCAISNSNHGSILNIPRENRLNRLYIQLNSDTTNQPFDRALVSPSTMLKTAQRILAPYTLDFKYCDWWSIYQIGQRIAPKFSLCNRIFLAGDSVHTHSPKLGIFFNVSLKYLFYIWCIFGSVLSKQTSRAILKSYEEERRGVALQLLAVDAEIARFYARDRELKETNGAEAAQKADFLEMRERMYEFLAGVGVTYAPSLLVAKAGDCRPELARGINLGARFPSFQVLNQADAWPSPFADFLTNPALLLQHV